MFAFRLCLELGYPHPDVLLSQISARQLAEWMAFYGLDPWGERRADLRNGILGSLLAAAHGQKVPLTSFLLFDEAKDRDQAQATRTRNANLKMWFDERLRRQQERAAPGGVH